MRNAPDGKPYVYQHIAPSGIYVYSTVPFKEEPLWNRFAPAQLLWSWHSWFRRIIWTADILPERVEKAWDRLF